MRKTAASSKRGTQEANPPPAQLEKCGWIRKYCGRGIFREIWKSRYLTLKVDQMYISEKESKDEKSALERFDLTDYDKCEELRKSKSRSKKNHSKFTLVRSRQPGNTAPNLIFLALSPEEKESWINALSTALSRAKNRILDEVTVGEESFLAHPTRDRVKIQHSRRPPTRGHLTAVASTSTSDGMLTLDLIQEEDGEQPRPESDPEAAPGPGGPGRQRQSAASLDQDTPPEPWSPGFGQRGKCVSEETLLGPGASGRGSSEGERLARVRDLVALKLQRTQLLLLESQPRRQGPGPGSGSGLGPEPDARLQAQGLLAEALSNWSQAQQVLEEIQELRQLCGEPEPGTAGRRGLM
ncbi:pleckstrin homology domain-containing family O member 1-like [Pristis pectinata]|uniref:pleckstrin homology domain-containing family O member 1-like n=1 Tax=Pristis pectinata TaxID=685728 RepID=UPI00223D3D8A|nr:pleckstrin homology domain-containing family O member 1-like [Pristis pectinata]